MWGIYPPKKVSQGSPPLFSFPLKNRGISKRTPSFWIVALFLSHDFRGFNIRIDKKTFLDFPINVISLLHLHFRFPQIVSLLISNVNPLRLFKVISDPHHSQDFLTLVHCHLWWMLMSYLFLLKKWVETNDRFYLNQWEHRFPFGSNLRESLILVDVQAQGHQMQNTSISKLVSRTPSYC